MHRHRRCPRGSGTAAITSPGTLRAAARPPSRSTPVVPESARGAASNVPSGGASHSAHIVRNGVCGYSKKHRLTLRAPCRQVQRRVHRSAHRPAACGRASHSGSTPGGAMQAGASAAPSALCQQKPVRRFSTQASAKPSGSSLQHVRSAAFSSTTCVPSAVRRQSFHSRRIIRRSSPPAAG